MVKFGQFDHYTVGHIFHRFLRGCHFDSQMVMVTISCGKSETNSHDAHYSILQFLDSILSIRYKINSKGFPSGNL